MIVLQIAMTSYMLSGSQVVIVLLKVLRINDLRGSLIPQKAANFVGFAVNQQNYVDVGVGALLI